MRSYLLILIFAFNQLPQFQLPIKSNSITLTDIGAFGVARKARPDIPAHLHTGIDIRPPNDNYQTIELIYPIASGVVISKRTDGPFAQLILEHDFNDEVFWTVYEHIADIEVELFQPVDLRTPLARFFMVNELDEIGWQFNHFHFEILRVRPMELKPSPDNPERLFHSFSLECQSPEYLYDHFYDPLSFFDDKKR